jgi:hypothetical protein
MAENLNIYLDQHRVEKIFINLTFNVVGSTKHEGLTFKNCKFNFDDTSSMHLTSCEMYRCELHGIEHGNNFIDGDKGNLVVESCKRLVDIKIDHKFHNIQISNSTIEQAILVSQSNSLHLIECEVNDFFIRGESKYVDLSNSYFSFIKRRDSVWDVDTLRSIRCTNTIFHKVKVNPFYFATKCKDKSSLDLTSATLIDDWSRLRKKYSGLSLFIVFLLSFVYFLPLITHSFFLIVTSKIEVVNAHLTLIPLWKSLLFADKTGVYAFGYGTLTIVLLTYNILRIYMTISVSKLMEEERFLGDSKFQLISIHPEKLKRQLMIDRYLNLLFYTSLVYAIFKTIDTLQILVPAFN